MTPQDTPVDGLLTGGSSGEERLMMPRDDGPAGLDRLVLVSARADRVPASAFEALATDPSEVPGLLAVLDAHGIDGALWLATCDRVLLLADPGRDGLAGAEALGRHVMAERAGCAAEDLARHLDIMTGVQAARHVFRIAASLESRVPGEPHVLGQLKAAHRHTIDAGLAGGLIDRVLAGAYSAAKAIRAETRLGERPTSISAAAVQTCRAIFGEPADCSMLVVGVAEAPLMLAEAMGLAGCEDITITAPAERRAEMAARHAGTHFATFDRLETLIARADVIVTGLGRGQYIVDRDLVTAALKRRRWRPMLLVDAASPADIAPGTDTEREAFVYTLADLEQLALSGLRERDTAFSAAEAVVERVLAEFAGRWRERAAGPAIVALRQSFEETRAAVLAELGPDADADSATRLLVKRLLHGPTIALRHRAGCTDGDLHDREADRIARVIRQLFDSDHATRVRTADWQYECEESPGES